MINNISTENLDFSIELAEQLLNSSDNFPVDFDLLWRWCGYSRKDKGKQMLAKNFEDGIDYRLHQVGETREDGSFSHYWTKIELTTDCAKEFGMLAQTDKGKLVRKYFIAAEKKLKANSKRKTQLELLLESVQALVELERVQQDHENRITAIEQIQSQAKQDFLALPACKEKAIPMPDRSKINYIIRTKARRDNVEIKSLWSRAYTELSYRCHYNVRARVRLSKLKKLDQIEKDGMMGKFYAIVSEIYVTEETTATIVENEPPTVDAEVVENVIYF